MNQLQSNISDTQLPFFTRIKNALASFSLTDKVIFGLLVCGVVFSSIYLIHRLNRYYSVEVPIRGGTFTEGVVGSLYRHINPVLAVTDSGRDLTQLIFSGLMRSTPEGTLIPDLAESYTISEDGKIYTFTIRENATFHDGTPVTADDVVFTVEKVQDPLVQSPKRASFAGIVVQKVDTKVVQFVLPRAYVPFIENVTLGILPKHIWKNISAEEFALSIYNEQPIGSGPYEFTEATYDSVTRVPQQYKLTAFTNYTLGTPYIETLVIKFYPTENAVISAFNAGEISSMYGINPKEAALLSEKGIRVENASLPRVFGLFFNQNQSPALESLAVRKALQIAIDKEAIVTEVLHGYAEVIDGPIPPGSSPIKKASTTATLFSTEEARKILTDAGWTFTEEGFAEHKKDGKLLQFSITTSDAPELVQVARMIQSMWQAIGADVEVKIFESGELTQNSIRPRRYDVLLFGEIIGRDLDLYAFWHSSQRNDPGLNIANYVNLKVDKILENTRTLLDRDARSIEYEKFETEIKNDIPAIFLYAPQFIYIVPQNIHGLNIGSITTPAERFSAIHNWYIETDYVWKIFIKNQ